MQSHPALTGGILTQSQCKRIYSPGGVLLDANGALGANRRNVHGTPGASVSGVRRAWVYLTKWTLPEN